MRNAKYKGIKINKIENHRYKVNTLIKRNRNNIFEDYLNR